MPLVSTLYKPLPKQLISVLVVGSLLLRILSGGKHEMKTTDLVFLVLPMVVVALATGKLGNVEIFGVKADFSTFHRI